MEGSISREIGERVRLRVRDHGGVAFCLGEACRPSDDVEKVSLTCTTVKGIGTECIPQFRVVVGRKLEKDKESDPARQSRT